MPPSSLMARLKATSTSHSQTSGLSSKPPTESSNLHHVQSPSSTNSSSFSSTSPKRSSLSLSLSSSASKQLNPPSSSEIQSPPPLSLGKRPGFSNYHPTNCYPHDITGDTVVETIDVKNNGNAYDINNEHRNILAPPPFYMCSESEALNRQAHFELSPFECYPYSLRRYQDSSSAPFGGADAKTKSGNLNSAIDSRNEANKIVANRIRSTLNLAPKNKAARPSRPVFNPHHVIKKYRRSAAGGGTTDSSVEQVNGTRTLDQLETTVDYLLLVVFPRQMPPLFEVPGNTETSVPSAAHYQSNLSQTQRKMNQQHEPFSLCETVAFIDDRLRAVQKDLVTLLGNLEDPLAEGENTCNRNGCRFDTSRGEKLSKCFDKRTTEHALNHKKIESIFSTVKQMQSKIVRYHILVTYLLSEAPSAKYEVKFGARALRTALYSYLNLSTSCPPTMAATEDEIRTTDEMMAYMAILHSSSVIRSEEGALPPPALGEISSILIDESGCGWGALLETFRRHVSLSESNDVINNGNNKDENDTKPRSNRLIDTYPRWKWALELATAVQEGNFQRYFFLLERGPATLMTSSPGVKYSQKNSRFIILSRCCAAHSLNLVRLSALRRYNHSFGKGEKVKLLDIAKLLCWIPKQIIGDGDSNDAKIETNENKLKKGWEGDIIEEKGLELALQFCQDAGLPVVNIDAEESRGNHSHVLMKAAPISMNGNQERIRRMCNPGRSNDFIVFGVCFTTTATSSLPRDSGSEERMNKIANINAVTKQMQLCHIGEKCLDNLSDCAHDDVSANRAYLLSRKIKNSIKTEAFARVDEDGVVIPPNDVLLKLIN